MNVSKAAKFGLDNDVQRYIAGFDLVFYDSIDVHALDSLNNLPKEKIENMRSKFEKVMKNHFRSIGDLLRNLTYDSNDLEISNGEIKVVISESIIFLAKFYLSFRAATKLKLS